MDDRAVFRSRWLPYALIAPQIAITLVFFFWPAAQALYQSVLVQDVFGTRTEFVWFDNFKVLWNDPLYLRSFRVTAVFSLLVAVIGLAIALLLAVFADRIVNGAAVYKTLLIWPYAVAAAVAGVLWLFLLSPSIGIITFALRQARRQLELLPQRRPGADADRDRRRVEADQLQLPVLPRRAAVDPEVDDRGRGDRRRRADAPRSGRSSSRCCRRRRSSCSSSTSSTRSSTRSRSSTRRRRAAPGRRRRSSSTRCSRRGCRRSTFPARRRSPWS